VLMVCLVWECREAERFCRLFERLVEEVEEQSGSCRDFVGEYLCYMWYC
jgi:hypothetical protein